MWIVYEKIKGIESGMEVATEREAVEMCNENDGYVYEYVNY